jgi:hypothetical protein
MEEIEMGTAHTVAELVKKLHTPGQLTLKHPTDGIEAPVVVIPTRDGLQLTGVDSMFSPYREHPKRRTGQAVLKDVASFIGHVNRFKNPESALFADNDPSAPGISCVFDYHDRVNIEAVATENAGVAGGTKPDALPRFMAHQAAYQFPLDKAWTAWQAYDGRWMGQNEFALFIEERNEDILARLPDLKTPTNDADKNLAELVEDLSAIVANRRTMMGLSVGLSITATSEVVNVTGINNGTGSIVFKEENKTTDHEGRKIDVPTMFLLGVPVFENGGLYRVVARLRYKRSGGAIQWKYDLYRDDKAFDHAFKDVCEEIRKGTGLPAFVGAPEAASR